MNTILEHDELEDESEDELEDESEDELEDELEYDNEIEMVNLLNMFMIYYKKILNLNDNTNMFQGIEYKKENETNKSMEMFYDEMDKYKNSHPDTHIIIDHFELNNYQDAISNFEELYVVHIDDVPVWYGGSLLCLLKYLNDQKISAKNWNIYQHKKIN